VRGWYKRKGLRTVELAFDSKWLRTLCENGAQAQQELGSGAAEMLKHRLADLRAATSINDLIAGHPCTLDDTGGRQMVISLSHGRRVKICANHPRNPLTASGTIDWSKVSRIKILAIEVSHD
jgi:plasmid maintenance system killer protein